VDVDSVLESEIVREPFAVRAEDAGPVRVVDHERCPVAVFELDDRGERRDVAVHREDAVGHDELPSRARGGERSFEILGIGVAIAVNVGARQPTAVDQARVVELVAEDRVATRGQSSDDADVGRIARAEHDRCLGALVLREPLLQLVIRRSVAHDEPRCPSPHSLLPRPARRGIGESRVPGEPEVVVRGEVDELAPLGRDHLRAGSAPKRA
jgi:hypothetical protein